MIRLKEFLSKGYNSIWAKSPTFDITILRFLSELVKVDLGIKFTREMDVRTEILDYPQFDVREVSKHITVKDDLGNVLPVHHPLYDCAVQIQSVTEIYAAKFPSIEIIKDG